MTKFNVLITGSEGFVGKNISETYGKASCFDVKNGNHNDIFKKINGDSVVIHNGAISSTTYDNIDIIIDLNLNYTLRLFKTCYERGAKLIYASSASVYGDGKFGFSEESPTTPSSLYSKTKAAADIIAEGYISKGARFVGLRYFNVYGRNEEHKGDMSSVIYKFFKSSAETGKVVLFGGSDKIFRDFVHIDDIIKTTQFFVENDIFGIYNCGVGVERSFLEIGHIFRDKYGCKIEMIDFPERLVGQYQYFTKSDNSKLSSVFDHKFLTLEEGILKYSKHMGCI